ncbi:ribosomal protein S18-alanine N-acetyltransferase [Actinomadura barringtoniae]|uniref:Ribosomal protein S18-alanine N-acetyltransferase n=2 Tax=Actinomadura barringtoniae TaxID=1427535 RepID=A0A939T469_9ACTN|nr:ribosomal protein S18-alanine N-acetyltransferase [Actinomadura barringtoniae]
MTYDDLPAVMRLEHELFPEDAWSEQMLRGELDDQPRTRHYVVAETAEGEIIGYAGLAAAGGQADVQTIGVLPGHQGGGVGAALLTELLDEAVRRGSEAVFLEVRADNDRARRLYERFGFDRVGLRKRYYQPSGVDAIVMRRNLGGGAASGGAGGRPPSGNTERAPRRAPVGFTREQS